MASGGVVLTSTGYSWLIEPRWLESSNVTIRLRNRHLNSPVRILHLSDFHYSTVVPLTFINDAIQRGLTANPDLICVTGDFLTGRRLNPGQYRQILRCLSKKAPTFACLGNHDGGEWSKHTNGLSSTEPVMNLLTDSGITCLHNASAVVSIGRQTIRIIGVGDLWSGDLYPDKAFTNSQKTGGLPTVLLAHNPDSKDMLSEFHWDLMLSGHTHGGQLVVPLIGTPFAPVHDQRYVRGLNTWKGRWIYTTRGIGNLYGIRINCRPEISVLTLN